MNEPAEWRSELDSIISQLDSTGKRAIYAAVEVNRISFRRWITGENTPDARHVQAILDAVSAPRRERLRKLMMNDPKVRKLLSPETLGFDESLRRERIPQGVCEEVLRAARNPPDRFWTLSELILGKTLKLLEGFAKDQQGLEITVAKCMPPRIDGKIRSLREFVGLGTGRADLHLKNHFLGAESIAGYAVTQRHGIMMPDVQETATTSIRSAVAYPIMYQKYIAGALVVWASQTNFFSSELLTLIENYADLIRLAFYDKEFFPSDFIDLAFMPPPEMQDDYFASFYNCQNVENKQWGFSLTEVVHINPLVHEHLERELLLLASSADEPMKKNVES